MKQNSMNFEPIDLRILTDFCTKNDLFFISSAEQLAKAASLTEAASSRHRLFRRHESSKSANWLFRRHEAPKLTEAASEFCIQYTATIRSRI